MGRYSALIQATYRITTKVMYKEYKKANPSTTVTYNKFKLIVCDTHKEIVAQALKGGIYNFGHLVGTFSVIKFQKKITIGEDGKLKGLRPNYGATNKAKADGKEVVIYHKPDSYTCKWAYRKANTGRLKNKSVWSFIPTDGPKGISRVLHKYLDANPRATANYKEIAKRDSKSLDNKYLIKE